MNRLIYSRTRRLWRIWLAVAFGWIASQAEGADDGIFNARKFGAAGDGVHLDSPAIDQAILAASKAGGGTVLVPAGKYLSGSIHLKSNIHLVLEAGATIVGAPQSMKVYDETEPWDAGNCYQDGGHCYFHNSLIWGENLTNVSITGQGTIDGDGLVSDDSILDRMCGFSDWDKKTKSPSNLPAIRLGNKAVALKLCRNVLIRDITIIHGGHFAVLVTGCDNLTVDNMTLDTNRDGIDIDCCRNTVVSNCRINAPNDDALCPKSSFALGRNVITENLTIVNCQLSGFAEGTLLDGTMLPGNGYGRIKFGTEASGGFRNCTVSNCTFRHSKGLALEEVDGGTMENISVDNLTMVDVVNYAIYVVTGSRNRGGAVGHASVCRNISISNVIADRVSRASGIQIMGTAEKPLEGIRLENIQIDSNGGGTKEDAAKTPEEQGQRYPEPEGMPAYGIYARHVRDLELKNIRTSVSEDDARPAASFSGIDGLEVDHFKATPGKEGAPSVIMQDVRNATFRDSPGFH